MGGCGEGGGVGGLLRNTILFYTEALGTQVGVDYFILSDNMQLWCFKNFGIRQEIKNPQYWVEVGSKPLQTLPSPATWEKLWETVLSQCVSPCRGTYVGNQSDTRGGGGLGWCGLTSQLRGVGIHCATENGDKLQKLWESVSYVWNLPFF